MTRPEADREATWKARLLIPVAALAVVSPLIVRGCSCGHDFNFHLLNWMEVAKQFSQGNAHPHWAYSAAFNAGEPRFVFYPPLSWTAGGLLGLILTHLPAVTPAMGWTAVPIVFTWLALTLSGLTMHRLARAFTEEDAALLASVFYLANPYMLFTAFERGAYAELLAMAWIPLLLLALMQEEIQVVSLALPVALLWLTNAPAAVIGSYTLAFLAGMRLAGELCRSQRAAALKTVTRVAAGTTLGMALAAFYLIPAAYERRFVQVSMATIGGMRVDQNFLFEHTGTTPDAVLHDQVLHTASLIAVMLLCTIAAVLFTRTLRRTGGSTTPIPWKRLVILTFGIAWMLTPFSTPLWNYLPEALFLQFPWRLTSVLACILAFAGSLAMGHLKWKFRLTVATGACLVCSLTAFAYPRLQQSCDLEDTPRAQLALFHSHAGSAPTDEYTPSHADNDELTAGSPPYWLAAEPDLPPPQAGPPATVPERFTITARQPQFLILNLRSYPAWHVNRNGLSVTDYAPRADGRIALPIPAGNSLMEIQYRVGADQRVGDMLSLASLAVLFWQWKRRQT